MITKESTHYLDMLGTEILNMKEEDFLLDNLNDWELQEIFEDVKTTMIHKKAIKFTDLKKEFEEAKKEEMEMMEDHLDYLEELEEGI